MSGDHVAATFSRELGVYDISPAGEGGGRSVPASCPSDLHDDPTYGLPCTVANSCGQTNTGVYQCGGVCNVAPPSDSNCSSGLPAGTSPAGSGAQNKVPTCPNGAIDPTACQTCGAGRGMVSGLCVAVSPAVGLASASGVYMVKNGSVTTLRWDVVDVKQNSCTVGDGAGWSVPLTNASSDRNTVATPPITEKTVFTLSCTGLNNSAQSTTTTINLIPTYNEL
ncbi:MAG TPA: hypothetical protein VF803_01680 [Candidatus Paceibacterota bacterium]